MIHVAGVHFCSYWAKFPTKYLQTIREDNVSNLKGLAKIALHHTKPKSLVDRDQRDQFLREFVAIIRCLAAGSGNVGFLRNDIENNPIYRVSEDKDD